jgi:hypothetical protein
MDASKSQPSPTPSDSKTNGGGYFSFGQAIAVCITGIGIGWLMGLSISPVVASVIGALFGIISGGIAALSGVKEAGIIKFQVNIWPLSLLVLGITGGAALGVYTRTHDLLGSGTIVNAQTSSPGESRSDTVHSTTVLFSQPGSTECTELLASLPEEINTSFRSSSKRKMRQIGDQIKDPSTLKDIARILCEES